jgi:hypothetical protein
MRAVDVCSGELLERDVAGIVLMGPVRGVCYRFARAVAPPAM